MSEIKQLLDGHFSEETAYVIQDYPSGGYRVKKRVWIETKDGKGKGQRLISQTVNPRQPGEVWCAPKKSIYWDLVVLYISAETGYLEHDMLGIDFSNEEKIEGFIQKYRSILNTEYQKKAIRSARYVYLARKHMDRLAGGNIYDIKDPKKKSEIFAQAKADAIKDVNQMEKEGK